MFTLLHATAVTDRWGATHYGRLTGLMSAPLAIAMSLAPWAGAAMAGVLGGYSQAFLLLALLAAAAAFLAPATRPAS